PTSVLDLGCGRGDLAVRIAREFGATVTGICATLEEKDQCEATAKANNVNKICDFKVSDMNNFEWTTNAKYDLILNIESSCYFVDRKSALDCVSTALRPNGRWLGADIYLTPQFRTSAKKSKLQGIYRGWRVEAIPYWDEFREY
ncbi:unnamed protein product, partial [Chrysoparadoxa australica]